MEILWWLVPPVVATGLAMLWVSWLGRAGRGEVDPEVAVRRLGAAMSRPLPRRAQQSVQLSAQQSARQSAQRSAQESAQDRSTGVAVRPAGSAAQTRRAS